MATTTTNEINRKAELIRQGDLAAFTAALADTDDHTALLAAALRCNSPAAVAAILSHRRAAVTRDVLSAALNAGLDCYRLLAAYPPTPPDFASADFDVVGGSLVWAVMRRDPALVRFLLHDFNQDPNACPQINGTGPLGVLAKGLLATSTGADDGGDGGAAAPTPAETEIVELLLARGADPHEPGLLYDAARGDRRWVLELLVGRCGLDVDADDRRWDTVSAFLGAGAKGPLLHYAAECGSVRVVEYLVTVCAKRVDELDADGNTPLARARAEGKDDVVRRLVALGAKM
ncbi:hypothetical protein DFJ73DRAFT_915310 [Zopfochytrium polystomum]|nr:hypothetical protein DFJ73DRAFT_915310 [Zopfochytrium polystomum]